MRIIEVKTSFHAPDLTDDVELVWPDSPRFGGLNIIGKGHSLRLHGGEMNGFRVFAAGHFTTLEIEGLRGDFSVTPQDALPLNCHAERCYISNCRFTGINGQQDGYHGDGVQFQDNCSIEEVRITDTTIYTAYQGIMHNRGVKRIFLDRVNIRDEPQLRLQKFIAFYFVNSDIVLGDDVWIDWPSSAHIQYTRASRVRGAFKLGIPPNGDFCK